jgi:RecA/RadA recombinase
MAAKKKASATEAKGGKAPRAPKPRMTRPEPVEGSVQNVLQPPVNYSPVAAATDMSLQERAQAFSVAMNKDGRKRVVAANDAPNLYELRRPTGILPMDRDIGGGFPAGGFCVIAGPDNAGKTWLLMNTYVMHQKIYGQRACIAHAIVEGGFDYRRALQMGLVISVPDEIIAAWNQERVQLGMPAYTQDDWLWFKRQIGVFQLLRGATGEELMHVVLEAVKANFYNLIGIDSVSVLLPEADEAKDVGETPKYAGNANLLTDFMRKYTPYTTGINDPNPTTVVGIMQVRANSDKSNAPSYIAKFMKDWHATGAWAIKHGKLVDIQIWDGALLKRTVHGQNQTYGKALHWRIEKGKAGCHDNVAGETEYRYDIPAGHDNVWSLIGAGVARGVFREERGRVEVYNPISWEKTTLGGHPDYTTFGQQLVTDIEFELSMRYYVLAAFGVQCIYRPLV